VNVAKSEFLQLKRNSEKNQNAAPKPTYRTAMPGEPIHTEVDQDERPEHEDFIGADEPDLVEQQNDAHEKDQHSDDEMPIRVP